MIILLIIIGTVLFVAVIAHLLARAGKSPRAPRVEGCTLPDSPGYNPLATLHNDIHCSLTPVIHGCSEENATNYDSTVTHNVPDLCDHVEGCTNPRMFNYNKDATKLCDRCCVEVLDGCFEKYLDADMAAKLKTADESNVIEIGDESSNPANTHNDNTCNHTHGCMLKDRPNFNDNATRPCNGCESSSEDNCCCKGIVGLELTDENMCHGESLFHEELNLFCDCGYEKVITGTKLNWTTKVVKGSDRYYVSSDGVDNDWNNQIIPKCTPSDSCGDYGKATHHYSAKDRNYQGVTCVCNDGYAPSSTTPIISTSDDSNLSELCTGSLSTDFCNGNGVPDFKFAEDGKYKGYTCRCETGYGPGPDYLTKNQGALADSIRLGGTPTKDQDALCGTYYKDSCNGHGSLYWKGNWGINEIMTEYSEYIRKNELPPLCTCHTGYTNSATGMCNQLYIKFIAPTGVGHVELEEDKFKHTVDVMTTDTLYARTYLHTDPINGYVYCFAGEEDKAIIYLNEDDEVMFVVKTESNNSFGWAPGREFNLTLLGSIPQSELNYWSTFIKTQTGVTTPGAVG